MKRYLFMLLFLLIPLALSADVDTKDGTAINQSSNIDGFTSDIGKADGQIIEAAGGVANPTDQFSGNPVFSVGTTATELDDEGNITVASNIATFTIAFPTNVGVGDVVQYDVDNADGIEDGEYGIIHGISTDRTMAYLLHTDGTSVTNTTATTSVYDIFRAYTSLANWESQTENTNIAAVLHDSTNSGTDYELNDLDLTADAGAGAESGPCYVACYADGVDGAVFIDGYTVDADDWIEIFTPVSTAMVGTTQRHSGVWDTSKYYIAVTDDTGIKIDDDYVRLDGLQVQSTVSGVALGYGIYVLTNIAASNEFHVSNTIIKGVSSGSGGNVGLYFRDYDSVSKVWNTVVYGFISTGDDIADTGFRGTYTKGTAIDFWNVTVNDCYSGLFEDGSGTYNVLNTLVFECTDDLYGTWASVTYSAGDDADFGSGTGNFQITQTADDYAALVTDADGGDYSVTDGNSELDDTGTDDPGGATQDDTDIADTARVSVWDIGAFEL